MPSSERPLPLPVEQLTSRVDPHSLPFATTGEAGFSAFCGVIGQQGARDAIAYGVSMQRPGYNIFVSGEAGYGRLSLARRYLEERAKGQETPADWLYLNNFAESREPAALDLPAGMGREFMADLERFVDSLLATLPAAFEHPGYQRRKAEIERKFAARYDQAVELVEHRALEQGICLFRDGETISFSPMLNGKAVSEDEFAAFSEEDKDAFHKRASGLEDYLSELLVELPQWRRETGECLHQLQLDTVGKVVAPTLAVLCVKYSHLPEVLSYLESMRGDLQARLAVHPQDERQPLAPDEPGRRSQLIERYSPRVLVSRPAGSGAPVIFEANPTYQNLFGRIEYINEQGALVTNHQLICPGALHHANGGYLLLEADKMVSEPPVWPALKRALKSRFIRIDSPAADQSAPAAISLSPEPVPLSLKIVLIGPRDLYYVLQELDDEFNELFRVLADFDDYFVRDGESILRLIALLKGHAESSGLAPLSAAAAARLIEYSGRLAEHQRRLSARVGDLYELMAEADLLRAGDKTSTVEERHVAGALAAREKRMGRISRQLLDDMLEGTILIDTAGQAVGRINGLTVLEIGDRCFGMPARITATVSPGGRGVVDIEREVLLGQSIHSKGVMILSGYLAHKYARNFPLAVSANLALEQSYGYVDGDSAALAELLALISALTGVPLRQALAVTGSINQYGGVQAVGRVNEKIEGFFQLCDARTLAAGQGVIIPRANVANLMLDSSVLEAARCGRFAIYAADTVDQALSLITGMSAGAVNRLAVSRLRAMAKWAAMGRPVGD